jgi:hypothetical protein
VEFWWWMDVGSRVRGGTRRNTGTERESTAIEKGGKGMVRVIVW